MDKMKIISIVISIYNEEKSIKMLYEELVCKWNKFQGMVDYEMIFVNDGSVDSSLVEIKQLQSVNNKVKIINFTRNFGHETAMTAGMEHAKGDAVLFMDGDGQNPPHIAIQMIDKFLEGHDIVLTKRMEYKQGIVRNILSKIFYRVLNFLSDVKFDSNYPDFRLISRKYVERIKNIDESERMFRGILNWIGVTNHAVIDFKVPQRINGDSTYNLLRYFNLGVSGILQFSIKPIRIATIFAVCACVLSGAYALYVLVDHIMNGRPSNGFATMIIVIISLFSIQTLIITLIGEYVGRIHMEVKKRPLYFADFITKENESK